LNDLPIIYSYGCCVHNINNNRYQQKNDRSVPEFFNGIGRVLPARFPGPASVSGWWTPHCPSGGRGGPS